MKKLAFLYNTHAGKGLLKTGWPRCRTRWRRPGGTDHPPHSGAGDATAVAAARAGEFDRIVRSGGDGTLHEVVAGLMGLRTGRRWPHPRRYNQRLCQKPPPPTGMEAMARVAAAAGVPRPVDIGSFNDRYFIYVAAFGAFTDVAYSTPQPVKKYLRPPGLRTGGATRLGSIQAYPHRGSTTAAWRRAASATAW